MGRGRKAVVQNNSDWESVFYNSVGTYVQYINLKLAEHIKTEALSNHIRIAGGYAFKSSEYKKHGIPVIRISDFSNEKIVLDDVVYYDESEDLKRYELNEGDIVIALTGGTIAKLGIVQKGIGKLYLNQRVGKFEVLHPEEFETEYVYWIARSVQSIIKNLAWGAAIPNVSPKQIEELQFPIPDKETQNGIIDFLNDLRANELEEDKEYFNNEIEDFVFSLQSNQINCAELYSEQDFQQDLVKQLRQAFLQEAMQGNLVAQNVLEGNAVELLAAIKDENEKKNIGKRGKKESLLLSINKDETPYDIPKNWAWCRLGDICKVKVGSTPSRTVSSYWGGDIPWVSSGEVANNLIYDTKETITKSGFDNTSLIIYPAGSVLVAMIGQGKTRGQTSILKIDATINQNVAGLVIEHEYLLSEFLWFFFLSRYETTRGGASGGNQPALNGLKISNTIFALPPLQEQIRIVKKLEELMQLCNEIASIISQSKTENEKLIKVLLNEALGVTTTYDVAKDKTLKQKIKKFYTYSDTFETISMKIIEILQTSNEPISATVVWNSSEYSKDIEAFYAELKRLIDIEKLVVEEKRGKESFLKLATNEN